MYVTKEQAKRLRAVKAAILAEPELYNQNVSPYGKADCGTACCIAGWAAWLEDPDPERYAKRVERTTGMDLLVEAIGLSYNDAIKLFADWPTGSCSAAWEEPRTKNAALDAARRIECFIETGQ